MAIAGAVLHQLATHTLPLTFFATHYASLTDDFAYHPNVRSMHMSTLVDDEKKRGEGVSILSRESVLKLAHLARIPVQTG